MPMGATGTPATRRANRSTARKPTVPKLPAAFPATSGSGPVECLGVTFESDAGAPRALPRPAAGEAARAAAAARLPRRGRRGHPAAVRPAVLHRVSQPVPRRVRRAPRPPVRSRRAVSPRAVRRRRQRRQDRPPLPGARLPHQGAAPGDRPVHPPLHAARRRGSRRFLRVGHDRRRRPVVRQRPARLPPRTRTALAGGRAPASGMGGPARGTGRPVAGGHVHRRQLQHPVRRRCVPRGRGAAAGGGRGGDRLDVRDAPHRRAAHRAHRTTWCGARSSRARTARAKSCSSTRRSTPPPAAREPPSPVRTAPRS